MPVLDLREKILEGDLSELLHHSKDEDYPAEVGKLLGTLPTEHAINTFLSLPEKVQIQIFGFLDAVLQIGIIEELPRPKISNIRSEERRVGKECRSRWSPYH